MSNSKCRRNQRGFTLVEVIVVAVIVAALAGVSIPLYLGYVESTRRNAAANTAGSIASFCGACINTGGALPAAIPADRNLICVNAVTGNTNIQVPLEMVVTMIPGPPRSVSARHQASDVGVAANTITYNY